MTSTFDSIFQNCGQWFAAPQPVSGPPPPGAIVWVESPSDSAQRRAWSGQPGTPPTPLNITGVDTAADSFVVRGHRSQGIGGVVPWSVTCEPDAESTADRLRGRVKEPT